METRTNLADSFRDTAGAAARLIELTTIPDECRDSRFTPLLDELRDRLESLPIPQETHARLTGLVSEIESLFARQELGAGRWQLLQIARRLRRMADEWDGGEPTTRRGADVPAGRLDIPELM